MRKKSTPTTRLARHSAAVIRVLQAARPDEQDEPGDQVTDAGGRERRDGLDGDLDREVGGAPDDVDREERQQQFQVEPVMIL